MIARIVPNHGTGSAAPAIHYIGGEKDHKGNVRDEVIHLFGDGQQIIDLTESMTCKHTYLSSVLSLTKEESSRLDLEDIQQLAESFAAHHAGPMGVDSIAGCSYLHVEDGRYDVHLVQAQLDLESGKRVDLYLDTCGDTQRIADWQDCKNYEMNLDDPRDPSRMRLTNDKIREAPNRKAMRALVNNHLEQQTISGGLTSRADVISELQLLGFEVMRQTEKSISIKSPDLNQNIRLTGGIFNESFSGIESVRAAVEAGQQRSEEDYRKQYESARTRLTESNEKRADRISRKLKINFEKRSQRLHQSDPLETMADLDSIGRKLSAARGDRLLVSREGQHPYSNGNADELSNDTISGQPVRHRATRQRTDRPERKLLDQTQIEGINHESTDHEISDYRTHVRRANRHTTTMRELSKCSEKIKQASKPFSFPDARGGTTFDRARRTAYESVERFTSYIEAMVLKIRQSIFQSQSEDADHVVQNRESEIEDIGMK